MHWYDDTNGAPKTHHRPRQCKECLTFPKGGCALPFRQSRKVRQLAALDKKPEFFKSISELQWRNHK